MTETPGGRTDLSTTLRSLRTRAGLSETEAARRVGISQAKVSRYEHGLFVPTADEMRAFARVYKASADERRRLLSIVTDLQAEQVPTRVVMHRGNARFQQRVGRIEQSATHVRAFNPVVVIGLLQTEAYARAIFSSPIGNQLSENEIDAAVDARLARQELLGQPHRSFTLIMTEGALRWQATSAKVMLEQVRHIRTTASLPGVRIGIIPWTTPTHIFPLHGMDLYDDRATIVGTLTTTAVLTDTNDLRTYAHLFTELEKLADFGDDAGRILDRLIADYRHLR